MKNQKNQLENNITEAQQNYRVQSFIYNLYQILNA